MTTIFSFYLIRIIMPIGTDNTSFVRLKILRKKSKQG